VRGLERSRVGIIGYGAIAREIVATLSKAGAVSEICGILVKPTQLAHAARSAPHIKFVATVDELLGLEPRMVAECAGHRAVADYGALFLSAGVDFLVASVGALVNWVPPAARANDGELLIPSGAVAGIDGLLAARTAGLARVTYTSVKPPGAWVGTPAGRAAQTTTKRLTFFEGTAREAALLYPKNANVAATVAYAGLGLDATRVRLVSDPAASGPVGMIEADGDFGCLSVEILAYASPSNPKTSLLTAHSMIAAWRLGVCFPCHPCG